jgi:phosphatidylserine/phosphatidylglycerophosphate/cardiolipin synthase-like enzyme
MHGRGGVGQYVVSGPAGAVRERVTHLFNDANDLRVAAEDLSDKTIVALLKTRAARGQHDRVLLDAHRPSHLSPYAKGAITRLRHGGVDVRTLPKHLMHEKYVDDGSEIYVGSANLTRNGLDEGHEVGVVAPATAFGDGAQMLRDDFDRNWSLAIPA